MKAYCNDFGRTATRGSLSPTSAQYKAATAEFDRLWETGMAKQCTERMDQLLLVIDIFEGKLSFSCMHSGRNGK
jgi:hypothetical protein